ncbi:DUF6455 family protein [Pukyongiella litopenaei]|uniref:Adenylosuccinate lyase n=1 Tax=Pukyongiella litopenaei TaxID=2605946 RepID=A0A2S0MU40_9RHOB|nr:DUF6455 family protein [Pukyongiella litopenaei]AVO39241.1 adenylosuccinate lyase [Pukyongiella litopenaei]
MGLFSKMADSADLVNGMAERLGADLRSYLGRDPEINAASYRTMVYRCTTCVDQDGCRMLQSAHDRLDHAPAYCRNKQELEHPGGS